MSGLHIAAFAGSQTLNAGTQALASVYHITEAADSFFRKHIDELKASDVPVQHRTGNVLDKAVEGFGIGIGVSTAIIAVGQLLLGNPLQAAMTVAASAAAVDPTGVGGVLGGGAIAGAGLIGAALTVNPIAITCGAIGAVVWGWGALSADEQDAILLRVSHLFEIGKQMVRSIVDFVLRLARAVFSDENLKQLLSYVEDTAREFGKTLADVTGRLVDRVSDAADWVGRGAGSIAEGTAETWDEVGKRLGAVAKRLPKVRKAPSGGPPEST